MVNRLKVTRLALTSPSNDNQKKTPKHNKIAANIGKQRQTAANRDDPAGRLKIRSEQRISGR